MEPYLSKNIAAAAYSALDGPRRPHCYHLGLCQEGKGIGAEFWTHTQVTGITVKNSAVRGVQTSRGEIETECAGGSRRGMVPFIGEMVGLDVLHPPPRGQTMVTEPLPPIFHKELLCARYIAIKHHPELAKGSDDPGLKLGWASLSNRPNMETCSSATTGNSPGMMSPPALRSLREVCNYVTRFVPLPQRMSTSSAHFPACGPSVRTAPRLSAPPKHCRA